jgi:hypothetical protein
MTRFRKTQISIRATRRFAAAPLAFVVGMSLAAASHATVTATADPADRYGTSPAVFTIDPFDPAFGGPPPTGNNRGIANTRRLRQTFKNPAPINVGQINISFDVTGGSAVGTVNDTGLRLAFYEVDDVLSGNWTPGALLKEIVLQPGNMPASNQVFRFDLTAGDVFALPQRDAGTTGYGLEISTPNSLASDGNPGLVWFTAPGVAPNPNVDYYAGGRYYTESGTASSSFRDVGLSLLASSEVACDPGDVNCDMVVNEDDLELIAAHFRQNGAREDGDLTGNGFIDFDDFDQWKRNASGAAAGSALFSNVPEPASGLLAGLALAWMASIVRSRRRSNRP